jgi:Helix-turn-helix domain
VQRQFSELRKESQSGDKVLTPVAGHPPMVLERLRELWQRQLVSDRKIPGNYLKVAIAIGWHINRFSGWAHPGISTLAKLVRLSRPTVIRAIKWLEQKSHMRVIRTRADNRRGSNRYFPLLRHVATKTAKPPRMHCGNNAMLRHEPTVASGGPRW